MDRTRTPASPSRPASPSLSVSQVSDGIRVASRAPRAASAGWLTAAACATFAALAGAAPDAHAWFKVCNRSGGPATVAYAATPKDPPGVSTGGHRGVRVEGWWAVGPGECKQLSSLNAGDHELFFQAHGAGTTWGGNSRLCVRSQRFTNSQTFLMRDEACTGEWRAAGFKREPTAAANHTLNLN